MTIMHSPACRNLLSEWFAEPIESVRRRMASRLYHLPDIEIRDYLLTVLDEDPADSEPVAAAHQLWPLLVLTEPLHAPEELLDELDSLAADFERMRMRAEMLAAKCRALEPWSERWDNAPSEDKRQFGRLNVQWTAAELDGAVQMTGGFVRDRLADARKYAKNIHVYDTTEEQL